MAPHLISKLFFSKNLAKLILHIYLALVSSRGQAAWNQNISASCTKDIVETQETWGE